MIVREIELFERELTILKKEKQNKLLYACYRAEIDSQINLLKEAVYFYKCAKQKTSRK
ncbi:MULTISPECIES: hypothetical protein [Shouchella]|uniref:Spo0E like sporulation regulatory protein n=2 Tax=Shouchella TaxID=2893057 RepID=A0ABY7W3Y6_9BACI|nr:MULTISPECIES: hypothetical protein [Shouchella]MED4128432.1 hypothetical protein [Shouchella miscanthi]WDF02607.1 hypothetical protein PQ477_13910 [Shouchella hunanensis]GAF20790.1 hypothetical protein JCM19047_447 [Bacillus sp. JCM 19047]